MQPRRWSSSTVASDTKERAIAVDRAVSPPSHRFLLIDGLRGVAAMMVVFFHLYDDLQASVHTWIPSILDTLFRNGNLGVDVFFVLSGFAIAHSVRNGTHTPGYLARFALRRSIRLDPPLWVTIAAEIALIQLALRVYPDLGTPVPSLKQVLANVTYTQHFVGIPDIVPGFWSLVYEVQFYLVTVSSLVIWHKLSRRGIPSRRRSLFARTLMAETFIYSALVYLNYLAAPLEGLFIDRWFQFFLGVLAWAAVTRRVRIRTFLGGWLVVAAIAGVATTTPYRIVSTSAALATSALLVWAGVFDRMSTVLAGRIAQFLGKISYSLYLLHEVIGWRFVSLCKRLMGSALSPSRGTIVFCAGIAVSIASAWVMYVLVEAPSITLARRVRL